MCRRFSCTDNIETSKKTLIAWDKLCWPKASEGLHFLDIYAWNKATIEKLLWIYARKKTSYRLLGSITTMGRMVCETTTKQVSWMVQNFLKVGQHLEEASYTEACIRDMAKYSIG